MIGAQLTRRHVVCAAAAPALPPILVADASPCPADTFAEAARRYQVAWSAWLTALDVRQLTEQQDGALAASTIAAERQLEQCEGAAAAALDAVLETPAPTLQALLVKGAIVEREWRGGSPPMLALEAIIADVGRLAGAAAH